MTAWLASIAALIAVEVALAVLLVGRGRRRTVLAAALWGNLTFEPIAALLDFVGGAWPVAGLVILLFGEFVVYASLTPLRTYEALGLALLTNLVASLLPIMIA